MKTAFFISIFVLLSGFVCAQTTDYKVYRKQQQRFPTCTVMDSAIVNDISSKSYCLIASQLQIELQYYEKNGVQKAAAMATHSPNSKYRAYKRRFDYIILNTPKIHAADQAEARKKLFDLYPDTLALKNEYQRLLVMDSTLSFHLMAMMEAIDNKEKGTEKTQFTEEEFFQVASRFFYIDDILSDTSFQTHICIGINGVNQTKAQKDLTLLAAFSYEAIFSDFDRDASVVEQVFGKHKKELEQKMQSRENNKADLETLRNDLYTRMAQDLVFQKVLMDAYHQNKENLAFKLKPNNAYIFHLIPSIKDNAFHLRNLH